MKQCSYCGVQLDENANFCSLCGEPSEEQNKENLAFIETRKKSSEKKLLTDYQRLSAFQKRKIFLKISGLTLLSAILITLAIDFVVNNEITWSRYPVTVSLVLLLNFTMGTFWYHKNLLWGFMSFFSSSILLVLLDIFSGNSGWGMQLGIPLLFAAYLTFFLLIRLIRTTRQKGLYVVAYGIIASGIFSICTDGIINLYRKGLMIFGWSLIVMVSIIIISSLLLYIHFKLKKVTDLKRFFHI
jgi:hypothetical protein